MAIVADNSVVLAYDASYLKLAIRLAVPLATQDGALAAAATKAGLKAD